jgi:hypothetical protein
MISKNHISRYNGAIPGPGNHSLLFQFSDPLDHGLGRQLKIAANLPAIHSSAVPDQYRHDFMVNAT